MKKENLEQKLRLDIKENLSRVTKANSPAIWSMIHKSDGTLCTDGYRRIESKIINRVITGQITPAAAIPQIELEYNLM